MEKRTVRVVVDRALGSAHPLYPQMIYPVNYGYVPGVMAPDGEEQDAYVLGVERPVSEFTGLLFAVVHRLDDIEDKWVVVPEGIAFSEEEIRRAVAFQEQYFDTRVELVDGE